MHKAAGSGGVRPLEQALLPRDLGTQRQQCREGFHDGHQG